MRAGFPISLGLALVGVLSTPDPAHAWKPYTHNTSALEAYNDAVDDGIVVVEGRTYAVAPSVVTALQNWPEFYNAGVIGPDGFPDLTYGQSVIHPEDTGAWLRHVLRSAQQAQSDPGLLASDKEKILAFSYGFLTHAAGDMWGHTFVNDFALGVFPAVGEILTATEKAAIAMRHIIVEGYIGDATPGYDGFQSGTNEFEARAPAPGGDVSDDSTPGFGYDAPHAFIYRTLIDPAAATPSDGRGPIIDMFLGLREGLQDFVSINPDPIGDAISAFDDTVAAMEDVEEDCNFEDVLDAIHDAIACPIALLVFGFTAVIDSLEAFVAFAAGAIEAAALAVLDSYIAAWIDDIGSGLMNWSKLGLATTKGLFDAQTRRNLQNDECAGLGGEDQLLRAICENNVGMLSTIIDSADPFINQHLLSMLGAPDFVGGLREILQEVMDFIDDIMDAILGPLNPVRTVLAQIKEFATDLLKDAIGAVLGIDIDALSSFLTQPSRWVCLDETPFPFPPPLGTQTVTLFPGGEHDRLDGLLGIGDDHHVPPGGSLPLACGRFEDSVEVSMNVFPALKNTVTTAKLLLLDNAELNRALGDTLGRTVALYTPGDNVMVQALGGGSATWLRSIDSDHAWRQDGLPRFCDEGGACPGTADARPPELNGGNGDFPIWESCVLRPAFRTLFADWEGPAFPELEDDVSADDVDDPQAPVTTLDLAGTTFNDGSRTFVAVDHTFTQTARDAPAGFAFRDDQLALRRRVYADAALPGPFEPVTQGVPFQLAGADGIYHIEVQSADACHRFDGLPSPPEAVQTHTFTLDTTAPVVTCVTPPFGLEWDTDDIPSVDFDITDGVNGSGIASQSATVDGFQGLPGVVPTTDGAPLDLFFFYPGTRQVAVTAADNLGNGDSTACLFDLHASPESLLSNVTRAFEMGLIEGHGIANSLTVKLQQVKKHHDAGQHAVEANVLEAFVHELLAQRGKKVDAATADRFIAFAQDRIALGR